MDLSRSAPSIPWIDWTVSAGMMRRNGPDWRATLETDGSALLALEPIAHVPPLAALRRWLGAAVADLPTTAKHAVLTVGTELASNAFVHARGPRGVRLHRLRGVVWIDVHDGSPERAPRLVTAGLPVRGGLGLVLVDRLATRWGVEARAAGKTVWAELSW